MVRIAPHHNTTHPLPNDTEYTPVCAWADTVYVQWGTYSETQAFFEAFTSDGLMLRADEANLKEAEAVAFEKYLKAAQCDHHWYRKFPDSPNNGAGVCRRCNQTNTKFYPKIGKLGAWKDPLSYYEIEYLRNGALRPYPEEMIKRGSTRDQRVLRMLTIKARLMGIVLPEVPSLDQSVDEFCEQIPDSYKIALRESIIDWLMFGETGHIHETHLMILKKHLQGERVSDARMWQKLPKRALLRVPVYVADPNIEVQEDDVGIYLHTSRGIYRPTEDVREFTPYDHTYGGLLPGDQANYMPSPITNEVIIYLVDGRKLRWRKSS